MEQETANKLFEEGAFLFLFNVPQGTEIGIDFSSWKTGEKFKGLKMIPPGIHFVYYSAVSSDGQVAPRTGFFHNFKKKEIFVRVWDAAKEDFKESGYSVEEMERLRVNLKSFDPNLGPYPYDSWKKWVSLSNKLSVEIVEKIQPKDAKISSVADMIPGEETKEPEQLRTKRALRKSLEDQMLPSMQPRPGTALNFTPIPEVSYPEGSSAAEITRYSIDTSYSLGTMLSQWQKPIQLLGELQMAFLCFLVGEVYNAFEHWKNLVHLFCSAEELMLKDPELFLEFAGDLFFQMQEVPADFFTDIVSQDNFLARALKIFFSNVQENEQIDSQLKRRCTLLKRHVTQKFHWDCDAELDDEAPVIVSDD